MTYHPARHHRRSIRLRGYDYSQAGAYFVTICANNRECLFGEVVDGKMRLNDAGRMIEKWWLEMNRAFPTMETDEYIVMPNHFHGVVVIVGADLRVCPIVGADLRVCPIVGADLRVCPIVGADLRVCPIVGADLRVCPIVGADLRVCPIVGADLRVCPIVGADLRVCPIVGAGNRGAHTGAPLPSIIQWFKTMTTNEYIRGVKTSAWPPFPGKLWQRNYYEHIIRDEESLNRIREYIRNNPLQWALDRENPDGTGAVRNPPIRKDESWFV